MGAMAGRAPKRSDADKAKARYFYYQGLTHGLEDKEDGMYEYMRRAALLDPENAEAQYNYGEMSIQMATLMYDDSLPDDIGEMPLGRMKRFVDKYPDDFDEGLMYGYLNSGGDSAGNEGVRVLKRLSERYPDNSQVLVYLADAYQKIGDTKRAVEQMDRYEALEGKSVPISVHKMSIMLEARDTAGALAEVRHLVSSNPREPSYHILQGNLYEVINQPDSAEKYYLYAESLDTTASAPKLALMSLYRDKRDSVAYDKKAYEALLSEDMDREAKIGMLAEYLQNLINDKSSTSRGDYLFSILLQQYPHDPDMMNIAARYSAAKGNFTEAADQISYAIDMDMKNPTYWRQKMYYLVSADKPEEAYRTYLEAKKNIELDPSFRTYGAMLLMNMKRYSEARSILTEVIHTVDSTLSVDKELDLRKDVRRDITLDELNFLSNTFLSLGDMAFNMNDTVTAFRDYRNAIELNSDNSMAKNNYAYFLATSGGNLDKALELSEASLKGEEASNPVNLDTYAWILYLRGDYAKALEIQKKALEIEDEKDEKASGDMWDHYGDILFKNGDADEALKAWKKAVEEDPELKGVKEKIEAAEKNRKPEKSAREDKKEKEGEAGEKGEKK